MRVTIVGAGKMGRLMSRPARGLRGGRRSRTTQAGRLGRIPAAELPHRHPGDIDLADDHDRDGETGG